jgi:hypothetical protein
MIVSNTTPFIALCAADCLDIFPQVLGHIHVAESVVVECRAGGPIVVPDLAALAWVTVHYMPIETHPRLWMLDVGERDTIELAMKLSAKRVVIDERIGRNIAEYQGLAVTGTLGVLLKARKLCLIKSFTEIVDKMRACGVRYNPDLVARLARSVGEG